MSPNPNTDWYMNGALRLLRLVKTHTCAKDVADFCCNHADFALPPEASAFEEAMRFEFDESLPSPNCEQEEKGITDALAYARSKGNTDLGNAGNLRCDLRGPECKDKSETTEAVEDGNGQTDGPGIERTPSVSNDEMGSTL